MKHIVKNINWLEEIKLSIIKDWKSTQLLYETWQKPELCTVMISYLDPTKKSLICPLPYGHSGAHTFK